MMSPVSRPLVRWLARKLISIALGIGGSLLVAGAVAGLAVGVLFRYRGDQEVAALGGGFPSTDAVCRTVFRFGVACALSGVAAIVVWALSRGSPRPATPPTPAIPVSHSESTSNDVSRNQNALVVALGVALAVLPIALVVAARPAFAFIVQNREFLSQSLNGIFLMIPLFELTMTAGWLAAGIGLLLLFGTKDRLFPRAYLVMLTVEIGLLISNHYAIALTRSFTEPLDGHISIAQDHVRAVATAARNLAWVFAAYAVFGPVALLSGSVRRRFAAESAESLVSRRAGERIKAFPQASMRAAGAGQTQPRQHPAPGPGGAASLQSDRYFIQATYLGGPFGGLLQVRDRDSNRAFTARIAPLRLRSVIQVFAGRQKETESIRIEARQVLSLGGWYDVFDSSNHEKIAVVGKRFADDWQIHDRLDQWIGIMTRGDGGFGHATYHVSIGPHEAGTLKWSNVLKPALEIDYSTDVNQSLDQRLGVALGILLFIDMSPGA